LPSELYHSLALRECWELLEKDDPNNQAVLEILGAQAYARLTIMAVERFSEEKLSRQAKDAVAAGLEKYIYAYQASAEEKELAQNILTNYRRCAPQSTSSKGIFSFTNIAIGVSLGLAASAAAVTLLRK